MKSVVFLSEAPVSLQRLAPLLEARTAGRVSFTSPNALAVQRGADFADVLSSNDTLNDYEEGELEAVGLNRSRLHACVIAYRETELLAELLEALAPIATPAWIDDDHGTVMPVPDFLARVAAESH